MYHVYMYIHVCRFGKTAAEIVCANAKSSSRVLKDKITELMNGKYIHVLHYTFTAAL